MRRFFLLIGTLAIVIVLLTLAPVAGQAGQTPTAANAGAALKTPWGEPDLQGIWVDERHIPLQRPKRFAGREFLTDAEVAKLDEARAKTLDHDYRAPRGTENDVAGAYNAVYHLRKPTGRRTSLIVDPPDGRLPAFTPQLEARRKVFREYVLALAQATQPCKNRAASCAEGKYGPPSPRRDEEPPDYVTGEFLPRINRSDNPEDRGLSERCLAGFHPELVVQVNGLSRRIVQTVGGIVMSHDSGQGQGWTRNIVMNGSPHLPSTIRQWRGDSRGHWEGNTLVIDVTNFSHKTDYLGSRENLHLVERWTRIGPDTLEWVVTLSDPTAWTKPWTAKIELTKQKDEMNRHYSEPRCHEGNYGIVGQLSGGRADDLAYAQGRGPHPATKCIVSAECSEKLGAKESGQEQEIVDAFEGE